MERGGKQQPETQQTQTTSLLVYVAVIFAGALIVNLVSLGLFWGSPTRDLAVQIQEATKERLDDPSLFSNKNSPINSQDGVLTFSEISHLRDEIRDLVGGLDVNKDFSLENDNLIQEMLEL